MLRVLFLLMVVALCGCAGEDTTKTRSRLAPTSGLILEIYSHVGVTTSGADVTAWADQSGAGNDADVVSATKPTIVFGQVDGRPAIRTNGNSYLGRATFTGGQLGSTTTRMFVVQQRNVTTALPRIFYTGMNAASSHRLGIYAGPVYQLNAGTAITGGTPDLLPHRLTEITDATDSLVIDDTVVISGSSGSSPSQGYRLGASLNAANFADFDIYAVLVWNRVLTTAERETARLGLCAIYPSLPGCPPPPAEAGADAAPDAQPEAAADAAPDTAPVDATPDATPDAAADAAPDAAPLPCQGISGSALQLCRARLKIKHVIMIRQENRPFDHYFGMFPGADGFTLDANGNPLNCIKDKHGGPDGVSCVWHDSADINYGGPHYHGDHVGDIHVVGGVALMDGFCNNAINQASAPSSPTTACCDPALCGASDLEDVLGYKTAADIPNYWWYAQQFVLHDHFFEAVSAWSEPAHMFALSGWAARCLDSSGAYSHNPADCTSYLTGTLTNTNLSINAWTSLPHLLDVPVSKPPVEWRYYLAEGVFPDCSTADQECPPLSPLPAVPAVWNPGPRFDDIIGDGKVANITDLNDLFIAARDGTLPAVAWVVPSQPVSEHQPQSVAAGHAYVTGIINALMTSPQWDETAIFLTWDDWGGYYDHVPPPTADANGYGIRVPSLIIAPYAKRGLVSHQVLSPDAYLKLIEDLFLNGQRLDPATDGRWDPRPTVRENVTILGDLLEDFDFDQTPFAPVIRNQ